MNLESIPSDLTELLSVTGTLIKQMYHIAGHEYTYTVHGETSCGASCILIHSVNLCKWEIVNYGR